MTEPKPMTETEMLARCGSALHKIDTAGLRGTSMVTFDEIEAMAALIDLTGAGFACKDAFDTVQSCGQIDNKENEQ